MTSPTRLDTGSERTVPPPAGNPPGQRSSSVTRVRAETAAKIDASNVRVTSVRQRTSQEQDELIAKLTLENSTLTSRLVAQERQAASEKGDLEDKIIRLYDMIMLYDKKVSWGTSYDRTFNTEMGKIQSDPLYILRNQSLENLLRARKK
jgi:hypothetical protein